MRRTKIVCTVGPSSDIPGVLIKMIAAGMDVARFNMSHDTRETHARRMRAVREASREAQKTVALLCDTKGPEIRLGKFHGGSALLRDSQQFLLTTKPLIGDSSRAYVQYPGIVRDVSPGMQILIDDGNISLRVVSVDDDGVTTTVEAGGEISDGKKVNLPGAIVSLPSLSAEDILDIQFAVREKADFLAASFVRKPVDVLEIRRVIREAGGDMHIIAKIENREGVENLDEILQVADGLMVARGDLGVEIPAEEVPLLQKSMIKKAIRLGKPVITATQMLESMVARPRPTRAEASDVANAILDGSDAIMLSAETAIGKYPVESVSMMARIAVRTEQGMDFRIPFDLPAPGETRTVTDAVSHATCATAAELGAAAIITATQSGHTTRMVARSRPFSPIIGATPDERVYRKLSIVWGVRPVLIEPAYDTDVLFDRAVRAACSSNLVKEGDMVVLTAGIPVGVPGTTNMLTVQTVGNVALRGTGIGNRPATGAVTVINSEADVDKFRPGDILVTVATHAGMLPLLEQASGVIVEEGGINSHAAVACIKLGVPVLIGALGAATRLTDGSVVTLDPARGLVYLGSARV